MDVMIERHGLAQHHSQRLNLGKSQINHISANEETREKHTLYCITNDNIDQFN